MVGANVILYGEQLSRWIALDKDGKMLGNGNLKHVNVESSSRFQTYIKFYLSKEGNVTTCTTKEELNRFLGAL